jgi:hypothetical protein
MENRFLHIRRAPIGHSVLRNPLPCESDDLQVFSPASDMPIIAMEMAHQKFGCIGCVYQVVQRQVDPVGVFAVM